MKLVLKTDVFKELLSKANKGAGFKPLIERTNCIWINVTDNILTLTTTDGSNYLYIKEEVDNKDFDVVVRMNDLYSRVSRFMGDTTTLELDDNILELSCGKSVHKIPVALDLNGDKIIFPDPYKDFKSSKKEAPLTQETIKKINSSVKSSLATTYENPQYVNYYVKDRVLSTDSFSLSSLEQPIFKKERLVSPQTMDLIATLSDEDINVEYNKDAIVFSTSKETLYSRVVSGIESFSIDVFNDLLANKFKNSCELNLKTLLNSVELVSLSVEETDRDNIYLQFDSDKLTIHDLSNKLATEEIQYVNSTKNKSVSVLVSSKILVKLLKVMSSDNIIVEYDDSNPMIKFIDNDIIHLLSTNERVEED